MVTHNELRARLAQVSVDDLKAVHALFLEIQQFATQVGIHADDYTDRLELARRSERKIAQAIRAAQVRGELRTHGQSRLNIPSTRDYLSTSLSADAFAFANAEDEVFEQALKQAREIGVPGRGTVLKLLKPPPKPCSPTPRGRRTVEHMVVSINAIALGVAEVDPSEIPPDMAQSIEQALDDIGVVRGWLKKVKNRV